MNIQKIEDFCIGYWEKSNLENWPSVRYVSKRLGIRQKDLVDIIDGDYQMDTEYWYTPHKIGDRFIYVSNDRVEEIWNNYWAK